jgi:hypothetical protein
MSLFGVLDVKNIQHGAVRCRGARALRDGFRQQTLQLAKIANFCADIMEVMRGNLPHLTAGGLSGPAEPQQRADFVE